jgi:hypothetical protein
MPHHFALPNHANFTKKTPDPVRRRYASYRRRCVPVHIVVASDRRRIIVVEMDSSSSDDITLGIVSAFWFSRHTKCRRN